MAQSPLQRAVELTRQGRYLEARAIVEGVPEPAIPSQKVAFHRLRAAIAAGLHEPKIATEEMETALALAPQDSNLLLATASAEMQNGNFAAALTHAQASQSSAAREALIGNIEEARGHSTAALEAYKRAVILSPGNERYAVALTLELIRHQEYESAVKELAAARRERPKSAKILTLLGVAQYAAGYSDDAVVSLNDAIDADPQSHDTEPALAKIVLQSSAAPSEQTVRHLCAWNQMVCDALQLRVAREAGDQKLLSQATDSLERGPAGDPIRTCELARAYEWQHKLNEARRELEECVRLDGSPQNHYRLGLLYKRLGQTELANQEMTRRGELLKSMSEETALAASALQSPQFKTR